MSILAIVLFGLGLFQFYIIFNQTRKYDEKVITDTYSHLKIANEIHKTKRIMKYHRDLYPGEKIRYTYPPMLHVILALLQEKTSLLFRRSISLWFNLLFIVVFSGILFEVYNFSWTKIFLPVGLYLVTPINSSMGINTITPRSLGVLFLFLSVISIAKICVAHMGYSWLLIVGATGLFLTHRMGLQILYLFNVILLIYMMTYQNIGIFILILALQILSFTLAFILTRGQTLYMVIDHLKRIKLHITKGNQGSGVTKLGDPISIFRQNPMVILLVPIIFFSWQNKELGQDYFILLIMCLLILFLSVFWIWGSGERHILFATPFIILLYCYNSPNLILLLIPVTISCYVNYKTLKYRRMEYKDVEENWDVLAKKINDEDGRTLMILPEIKIPYLYYRTEKTLYSGAHDSYAVTFNRCIFLWRLKEHDHIKRMVNHYRCDLILVRKNYKNEKLWEYLRERYLKVMEGISYSLWKNSDEKKNSIIG